MTNVKFSHFYLTLIYLLPLLKETTSLKLEVMFSCMFLLVKLPESQFSICYIYRSIIFCHQVVAAKDNQTVKHLMVTTTLHDTLEKAI